MEKKNGKRTGSSDDRCQLLRDIEERRKKKVTNKDTSEDLLGKRMGEKKKKRWRPNINL